MPFYTRPLLPKNQSARALGIFQRGDRPPPIRQGILTLGRGRVDVSEAQGGCACCAVRGSLWVGHGAAAPAMRLDRDENVGYGGFSNCTFRADMVKSVSECMRAGDAQVQLSIVFTGGIYNGTV